MLHIATIIKDITLIISEQNLTNSDIFYQAIFHKAVK